MIAERRGGVAAPQVLEGDGAIDFDLHGVVGVRARGASDADLHALSAALGASPAPLADPPDLELRFTGSLGTAGLSWIDPGRTGFSRDGLYLLRDGRRRVRARVNFGDGAGAWTLECERGAGRVPLLQPMVRLAALRRRSVPLHAAAFEVDGVGVIASGWAHGGKTTALLAFMERGARFLADDWVLLAEDGSRMVGLPGPVTVSAEQAGSALVRAHASPGAQAARRALAGAGRVLVRSGEAAGPGVGGRVAEKLGGALARRAAVTLPPEALFGAARVAAATPRVLFLMVRRDAPGVEVEPLAPEMASARLASASGFEELPLRALALGYRFAFPDREAPACFEEALSLRERMVGRALEGVTTYLVHHAARTPPELLHRAMAGCLEGAA